jgi:hypothetical protein
MNPASPSKRRRRRGAWQFIFDQHRIVGLIEQRTDGQWRAVAASGQDLGLATTPQAAADLVREAARG